MSMATTVTFTAHQHHRFPPCHSNELHNAGVVEGDHDPSLPHELLWSYRTKSDVANITSQGASIQANPSLVLGQLHFTSSGAGMRLPQD